MTKKRVKKTTVRYIYEGKTEKVFLKYLSSLYPNSSARAIEPISGRGGTADSIISKALLHQYFDKLFVLLDEDFESKGADFRISDETLKKLEKEWKIENGVLSTIRYRDFESQNIHKRNPIIIFSNPQAIEGVLLQVLGYPKESLESKTTKELKGMLQDQLAKLTDKNPCYTGKEALLVLLSQSAPLKLLTEKRKTIPELDVILSIFE